jgi:catechol 2,3-dioxygenase-like lactoylglutathione lyase family enzyme
MNQSLAFYVDKLGFSEAWQHGENGHVLVAQVQRSGCELILTGQWPEKIGGGVVFISLRADDLDAARTEFEERGIAVKDGWWGYKLMIVEDLDGNQLYFPYASEDPA